MTKISLTLDTRKASYNKETDTYPIVMRVYHEKPRMIRLPYRTSIAGWHASECRLLKSAKANRNQSCNRINLELNKKLLMARDALSDLLKEMRPFDVDELMHYINIRLSGVSKDLYYNTPHNLDQLGEFLS